MAAPNATGPDLPNAYERNCRVSGTRIPDGCVCKACEVLAVLGP
jgi:hypothetical protein